MKEYKSGFVGLIGHPNSGKSFLLNTVVGEKVSIVTEKPQTTRQKIEGIVTNDQIQAIFVDAPGKVDSTSGINPFLKYEFENVIKESDTLLAVLNIDHESYDALMDIVNLVSQQGKPWGIVVTKSDLTEMWHRIEILKKDLEGYNVPILVVSALAEPKYTQEQMLSLVKDLLPDSAAPLFQSEIYTTQSLRDLAKEVIREKCFLNLKQELPYQTAIRMNKYEENESGVDRIFAEIIISKKRHQPMVLGERGRLIKKIGMESRTELEKIIGKKLYLDLHVIVRENWMKNKGLLRELGYEQPEQ